MKNSFILRFLFTLCAIVVSAGSAWGQAAVNTVMWSETWTGATTATTASYDATPSHNCSSTKGTTVYNSGTVSYTESSNAVYIRTDSEVNSGGNNLLLAKNNGSWTVSGIPTGSATELTVSYDKGGSGTLSITTSTTGASISGSTITTGGASTINLTFTNTNSSKNLRLDNISVKVKTAGSGGASTYTVTYNANGATSGTVPTDATAYTSGATVTVKDNTGSLAKSGYTFGGWNTSADGTGTDRAVGSTFSITANTTLYAKWNAKTVLDPVETPSFSPSAGEYNFAQSVTISCETVDATIHYTLDGSTPTTSSATYSSAISVSETKTIKAIAVKDGMANSAVASATYTMNIPSITAANVNLAYSATSGSIAYSISNTVEGGVLTAAITAGNEGPWMSIGEVGETIPITCWANSSTTDDRTATVTLTYTYNTDKTVTKEVTITQVKFVIDYAELPFSFDGGKSDIASKVGLTHSGLGSNYDSSPKLKFDDAGDCVILKINEAPGDLTFDIKGNSFSGGTFKVQTSADGSSYSDLKSYTSLGDTQSEEFTNLAPSVRYIKWVYTTKDKGNVALGNISLAKDLPYIRLNSYEISVTDAEAEGTLTATYKGVEKEKSSDVEIHWFESDGETTASEPSWAIVSVNDAYNVEYLIEENTSVARTAYFKVYGLDAEAGDVYSSLVTISQDALSIASLPFSFDGGKSDIASKDGLSESNLGSDYGSSPKLRFDETGAYLLLHIAEAPASLSYDIKNNGFYGGTFTVQVSADGKSYSDFKVYKSISATQNESFSLPSNVRYIKWVYTEKSSGNVALGNISVTAFDASASTITLGATLNNGRYWATFYNTSRYTLPAGAQAFTMNASNQLYLLGTNGSVIPAKTPVVVIADSASITLTKSDDETAIAVNGTSNILVGSDSDVLVSDIDGTPYVLGIKNGTLGFYKFVGTSIPAFKAYYIVK